jgi:hypothetical protein
MERDSKCLQARRNIITPDALAGFAPRFWARTTASFRHGACCLLAEYLQGDGQAVGQHRVRSLRFAAHLGVGPSLLELRL